MALNLTQIKNLWLTIRNAIANGENTATRVGQAGVEIVDFLTENSASGVQQYISQNLMGVIKAYIRPATPVSSSKQSYLLWHGDENQWRWHTQNGMDIAMPTNVKVFNLETASPNIPGLQANKIYILKTAGQVELDSTGGALDEYTIMDRILSATAIPRITNPGVLGYPFRIRVEHDGSAWMVYMTTHPGSTILGSTRIPDRTIIGMDLGDDWGGDGMQYYRCEPNGTLTDVIIGGGGTSDLFSKLIVQKAIGTLRIEAINPITQSPFNPPPYSFVSWNTNKWVWHVWNPISSQLMNIDVPIGTKVNMNGTYYILQSGNQYSEDVFNKIDILRDHVGVLSVMDINPASPQPTDVYVNWQPAQGGVYRWRYYIGDGNSFSLGMNTLVKKPNGLISKYYRLNDDGTATEDIVPEQYVGKARPLSGINFVKQSDSLIAEPPTDLVVNLDGLVGIFENNGIKSIFLRCNNVEIQSSSQGLGYAGFVGQVEYFMDDNDVWRMHIVGITEDKNKNEFYFAE